MLNSSATKRAGWIRKSSAFARAENICQSKQHFCPLSRSVSGRIFMFTWVSTLSHATFWHFLEHYRTIGVQLHSHASFMVHAAARYDVAYNQTMRHLVSHGVRKRQVKVTSEYSSPLKEVAVNEHMQTLASDSWLLYVDADEFAEFPCELDLTRPQPICASLVDRVAKEPTIPAANRMVRLSAQFPACAFARYGISSNRQGAIKMFLLPAHNQGIGPIHFKGSHFALNRDNRSLVKRCNWTGWISHYAWTSEQVKLNSAKRQIYSLGRWAVDKGPNHTRWHVDDMYRSLEHATEGGRFGGYEWDVVTKTRLSCCPASY